MSDPSERLVNLALYLTKTSRFVSAEECRSAGLGYPEDQDTTAFLRMFERDKEALRASGIAIEVDEDERYRVDRAGTFATAVELSAEEAATYSHGRRRALRRRVLPVCRGPHDRARQAGEGRTGRRHRCKRTRRRGPASTGCLGSDRSRGDLRTQAADVRLHQRQGRLTPPRGSAVRHLLPRGPLVPRGTRHLPRRDPRIRAQTRYVAVCERDRAQDAGLRATGLVLGRRVLASAVPVRIRDVRGGRALLRRGRVARVASLGEHGTIEEHPTAAHCGALRPPTLAGLPRGASSTAPASSRWNPRRSSTHTAWDSGRCMDRHGR